MALIDYLNRRLGLEPGPEASQSYTPSDPTNLFSAGPQDSQPFDVMQPPTSSPGPVQYAPSGDNDRPDPNRLYTDYSYYSTAFPQTRQDIDNAYMNLFGRPRQPYDTQYFNVPNYYELMQREPEAIQYAQRRDQQRVSAGPEGSMRFTGGDPLEWMRGQFSNLAPTTQSLEQLYEALRQNGVNVEWARRAQGLRSDDKLIINGQMYDFLSDVGGPNSRWTMQRISEGGGGAGGGEFTDPWGSRLEELTSGYISSLLSPQNRDALNKYIAELVAGQQASKQRAGEFAGSMGERVEQLRGPAFSEQQIAALRTGATDALERRRQQTLNNERERVYLRGFEPTSGLVSGVEQNVNRNFEQARTGIESELLQSEIDQTLANQRYADQLEGLIQQALSGGDIAAIQYAAAVADIENKVQQDALARQREAIGATQNPLALIASRLNGANATLALSQPGRAAGSYMDLMNSLTGQGALNSQNTNANYAALAQLLDIFLN